MSEQDLAVAEQLRRLNRQWMDAYVKRDIAFLQVHMSDDYVGTFPDGTVHDKRSEIDAVASGAVAITRMEPVEMQVRVYGEAAVMTGHSSVEATLGGKAMAAELRFTDVWIRRDGQWQAIASQVTRIESSAGTA